MVCQGIPTNPLPHEPGGEPLASLCQLYVCYMPERIQDIAPPQTNCNDRPLASWTLLAALLLFCFLAAPFFMGQVYTADDLGAFHLPIRAFYADRLAAGQPYDWMPQLFSGFYLTGEGQGGPYHPLHQLLYRILPLRAALGWEYLLPYPLMMLGSWLLLRRRLGRSDAAVLGGFLFTFSSFNLVHFVHPNAIAIIAHIPWLLWAIDIVLLDSRRQHVALASALIAVLTGSQLLLGYPQYVWFSFAAELCYAVFLLTVYRYSARTGCNLRDACDRCVGCTTATWPRLVIAKGIGLLLGGIQVLPTLDSWQHSARVSTDAGYAYWGSLHPLNLLQLAAPYLFADRVIGGSTHEFSLYIGAAPLMLIVWLLARRRNWGALTSFIWAILGFAAVTLLLSLGRYGLLYQIITWMPVIGNFRFPCRYLVLFQFAAAVLAATGFLLLVHQSHEYRPQTQKSRHLDGFRGLVLWHDFEPLWCVVGFSAAVAVAGIKLRHEEYIAAIPGILAGPLLFAAAAVLIASAARGRRAALVGLILLAMCDLGFYGLSYAACSRSATLDAYEAAVCTPPGVPDGRVVASLYRVDEPGLRTGDAMTLAGWRRADGYAGLEPRKQLDYRLLPSLRVADVHWVKQDPSTSMIAGLLHPVLPSKAPLANREKNQQSSAPLTAKRHTNAYWLKTPAPLPRVRMVTQVRQSRDPAADIATICPDTTILSEVPLTLPPSEPGQAVLASDQPGQLKIDVDCPAAQLLVISESYHAGWHASIDECPLPIYRINGDFMGCAVAPGKHRIELNFQPDSLYRGQLSSCVGIGLLCLCYFGCIIQVKSNSL